MPRVPATSSLIWRIAAFGCIFQVPEPTPFFTAVVTIPGYSSFAVPQVTAVLADYLNEEMVTGKIRNSEEAEKSDSARTQKARAYLQELAEDAGETGYDTIFGWGYIRLK